LGNPERIFGIGKGLPLFLLCGFENAKGEWNLVMMSRHIRMFALSDASG
jgi:hypothetical protein